MAYKPRTDNDNSAYMPNHLNGLLRTLSDGSVDSRISMEEKPATASAASSSPITATPRDVPAIPDQRAMECCMPWFTAVQEFFSKKSATVVPLDRSI